MLDLEYVYVICAALQPWYLEKNSRLRTSLFLFDTIGLEFFTFGIEKGLMLGYILSVCIALGTMTACFGGVIRDILC
jgi:uncharacterized membrane protein YeiH